ncbi:MAG: glycosyltransferase family 39 protein [Candidatus Bathyarchaeia archaeon]
MKIKYARGFLSLFAGVNFLRRLIASHVDPFCVLIIVAFSATIFFPGLGDEPLWVWDEQTHVYWAEHMLTTGDYLTPWAFGDVCLWISKPPLYMWLMVLAYHIFGGISNFATRFWSAAFGVLSCVIVFYLGKFLYNRSIGILSAFMLGTFTTFWSFARHAMLDVPLTFFLSSSIYFYILNEKSDNNKRYTLLSGIFFGLALMTKQVAAFLTFLIIGFYLIVTQKNIRFLLSKRFTFFWVNGLLIFAPWIVYMHLRFGSDFWQNYFFYSVFQRSVEPIETHVGRYLYYFVYLSTHEYWIYLLPFAISICVHKRKKEDILVLIWITVVLGVFTIAQTKLYWYILPVFPAFSIAISSFLYKSYKKMK